MFRLFKKTKETENLISPETGFQDAEPVQSETDIIPADNEESVADDAGEEIDAEETETAETAETVCDRFANWLEENVGELEVRQKALSAMQTLQTMDEGENPTDFFFDLVLKGSDYERAVEMAAMEGEIRGRNTRIEEEQTLIFDSDGIPHPGSSGNVSESSSPGIFRLARGAML
ncbi:MAG: hypothetical protein HDS71_02645 [Bacteroidales bacterium]|nr:hypothetical protein [Bacteroidales bacterium]MBD5222941.1 hypothetical protein [Bacteroidales bacterium]MBD5301550.1 hypothetical protein [Bacteroides sp.]